MRIGILGGLFPKEIRKEIEFKSKGPIQYAADTLQWNIVDGLDQHITDLSLINLPYIGSYPSRYKDIMMKAFNFSHKKGANDFNVAFINLPLYKLYSRYYNAKKYLQHWVTQENEVLIVYAIHTPFILAAIKAKEVNPKLKICLIVPDLPAFMGDKKSIIMDILKKAEKKILKKALLKIDSFVILSKFMKEPLNIGNRPSVCIEGIFSGLNETISAIFDKDRKSIFYSGTLAARYGIMNLLESFKNITYPDYELWICGDGDAKEEIIKRSKDDPRIKFYGQLPRERVLELQKKATVLVNPRTSSGEFTKYSFPSKTIEYLASGTPVILHKLPGIPDEYFENCFVAEEESSKGLLEMIVYVCEKPVEELASFGKKAQEFIFKNKNAKQQTAKILKMLQGL